jgi:UDP-N-acetylmuramate dehydrogenase
VSTRYYFEANSISELAAALATKTVQSNSVFILGGGSNVVYTGDYRGVTIKMNIKGIDVLSEDEESVVVRVGAGEDWPAFVAHVVAKGWGGVENLALVPGTAGAAPVQNIACYGHNLHESLLSVEAVNAADGSLRTFSVDDCEFGYRTSVFKGALRGRFIIVAITLNLSKRPVLNTSYRSRYESVADELKKIAQPPYDIKDVYAAIVNIRRRKLPDVAKIGTVGSVFKNPVISWGQLAELKKTLPEIQFFPEKHLTYASTAPDSAEETRVKIPAAWLIEEMGWAGKRVGNCGTWKTQPINIVNFGGATPEEYVSFVKSVADAVYEAYSIPLETEVVLI